MLRVTAVSHSAVIPINQEPFSELARAGAQVTVIAPQSLRTDIRGLVHLSPLPDSAAELVGLPVTLGGYRPWLGGQRGIHVIVYRGLAAAIAASRPDVLFVEEEPGSLAALQCVRAAGGVPVVVHENQNIVRKLPIPFEQIRSHVLSRVAGVTVRNEAATTLVRMLGFTGPVGALPHAVDPARYSVSPLTGRTVVFVGRLVREKGILDLIEAVAHIDKASLLVVGDGPLSEQVRARAPQARFTGAVPHDDVPSYLAEADVVVIPSRTTPTWKEQFGRIVIEANAAGVPVVVTDSGELGATVRATGGGVVVPEGNADALRSAIADLLDDEHLRRELGKAGRDAVLTRFTPAAVATSFVSFLSSVAR